MVQQALKNQKMSLQILVNNEALDLDPGEIVEFTFQVNNIAELRDQQTNFTNGFAIPYTSKNNRLLENAQSVVSGSVLLYRKIPCTVRQNGHTIVPSGVMLIQRLDSDSFDIAIYSGTFGFFESLNDLSLRDLDLSALDHFWDWNVAAANANNFSGFIYPVMNQGSMLQNVAENQQSIKETHPCVYVKTIVDAIFQRQGVNKSGQIFSNPLYQRLIIQLNELKVADPISFNRFRLLRILSPQTINAGILTRIDWNTGSGGSNANIRLADDEILISYDDSSFFGTFESNVNVSFPVGGGSCAIRIMGEREGELVSASLTTNIAEVLTANIKTTDQYFEPFPGQSVSAYWVEIENTGATSISVLTDSDFASNPTDVASFGRTLSISQSLPDINIKTFLKGIYQMFGIITQYDPFTNTLNHVQFKELRDNIKKAVDWSSKIARETYEYNIDRKFAQRNIFKYQDDQTVPSNLGRGRFLIDDQNLPFENVEIELPFAASKTETFINRLIASTELFSFDGTRDVVGPSTSVPVYTKNDIGLKILTTRDESGQVFYTESPFSSFPSTFNNEEVNDYKIAYFIDPNELLNLGFDNNLIDENYIALRASLDREKSITLPVALTENEASRVDFFTPIYLDVRLKDNHINGYFYIKQIEGVRPGRFQTVTLLKL